MNSAQVIAMICPNAKIGAEIGVWRGKTSKGLFARIPGLKLYMIDPWQTPSSHDTYFDSDKTSRYPQSKYDNALEEAKGKVRGKNAVILREKSEQAIGRFEDGYFDFVFIDGDHTYEGVKRDIKLWKSKVKKGGCLIGHDYYHHSGMDDVRRAVTELLPNHNVEPRNTQGIWWIRL